MPRDFSMAATFATIVSKPSSPKSSCSFFSKSSPRAAYSWVLKAATASGALLFFPAARDAAYHAKT